MLILDDGTFLVGNTFITIDDSNEFHETRNNTIWMDEAIEDSTKEGCIVRAFDYLKVKSWNPECFMLGIPPRIIEAQCIAALKEFENPNSLQADKAKNVKRERIEGVIETEYFSKDISSSAIFTIIDNLIAPYLKKSFVKITRKLVLG